MVRQSQELTRKKGILYYTKGKQTSNKSMTFEDTSAPAQMTAPLHEKHNPERKPVTRRGRRKCKSNIIKHLKILTINIRGVKSKINSLTSALHTHGTHIAGITETHINKNEEITIKGYQWIGQNRANKAGGGTGFLIRNDIKNHINHEEINDSEADMESQWIDLKIEKGITIGLFYGKQESAKKEEVERQFQELTTKINIKQKNNNNVIIMGDFNAKIAINTPLTKQTESRNGTMLTEVLAQTNTEIVNTKENHTGSWTRVNRKKVNERSIIDYIITSKALSNQITESSTDENCSLLIQGKNPTDHNTLTATLSIKTKTVTKKSKRWKKGDEDQWKQYNEEVKKKWALLESQERNINQLQGIIKKSMISNIGTRTIYPNKKIKIQNKDIEEAKKHRKCLKTEFSVACKNNQSDTMEIKTKYIEAQKQVRKLIEQEHQTQIRKTTNQLIKQGGANSNMFWKLRKQLLNHNKQEEFDTINEEGDPVNDPTKAKKHIADYFEDLYQARKGEDSHEGWTEYISRTVQKNTQNSTNEPFSPFSTEEFNECIKKLKRNKSSGPDMMPNEAIIEADEQTRKVILEALNDTYNTETIPTEWQKGEIIRIYKGKGTKGKCSNERGITLSSNMGKLFERLLDERIKNTINITEAQAGGKRGKATSDHLLVINSLIKQTKQKRGSKPMYIALLDVTKAYDKAWNDAIIYTAYSSGIQGKNLRIMKKLNENLSATIKTKYGSTMNTDKGQHKTERI